MATNQSTSTTATAPISDHKAAATAPAATHSKGSHISDASSLSNPNETLVTNLEWKANIDFKSCSIQATASYDVEILTSTLASFVKFDTAGLDIQSVLVNGKAASLILSASHPEKKHLGQCLEVALPGGGSLPVNSKIKVDIVYSTTAEGCTAAQWLPPAQTAGKKYPYLFTQCQAIHARSLIPCQDCPGVKMTYKASVTVPSWATCVMSALSKGSDSTENDQTTFHFEQPVPISSYLFALAVGDLESIDISPRCRVWSEPSMVKAVAYEFAQTEDFLKEAEALTFPYQWGRYDLLCLPPSFPYGGMENPCLTFVTPTLLAGDRSLADVVAHEIAHSWTGNLVTNATWEHFWLNEGWTMWLQRKIMTRIKNDPKFFDFDAIGGWKDLKDTMNIMPDDFTRLIPLLGDKDPDDAFSVIPYEKGFNLLYALERRVGTKSFEDFAKAYLKQYKYLTVTSEGFKEYFESYFNGNDAIKDFDWDAWLHKPGMPPETPDFDRTLSRASESLAETWISYDDKEGSSPLSDAPSEDITNWSSNQITCFLDALLEACDKRSQPLKPSTVFAMKQKYGVDQSKNSEILYRFCEIAIAAGDASILPVVVQFITSQGRMKFVRPLYRSLFFSEMGKSLAVDTFLAHRDFYHPICAKMIASDLGLPDKAKEEVREEDDSFYDNSKLQRLIVIGACVAALGAVGFAILRSRR